MAENFGAPLHLQVPSNSAQRTMFKKCRTYLAMIAFVLQDSPDKKLTFSELLEKLQAYSSGNRKRLENNMRFCLSTNTCFVLIPARSEKTNGKKNYWRIDHSQITGKMVRRHFKGILDQFPELASKVDMETARPSEQYTTFHSPEPVACRDVQIKCEVKFSSPFSIESLLKKDCPSGLGSKPSPLCGSLSVRVEQQPWCTEKGVGTKRKFSWDSPPPVEMHILQPAGGSYPIYPPGGNVELIGTEHRPVKRIPVCAEPSFLFYTRPSAASYSICPQNGYVKYPVPTYPCELQQKNCL